MSNQAMASIADVIGTLPIPYPPISLTKHYKGITLNQQGRIVAISPNSVTIQATQRRTFHCLDGMIHLRSGAFPGAISATIHPIDYTEGTFQLSDLSYGDWQDRRAERVQPKNPIYLTMKFSHKTFRAFMEDICTVGMGILVNSNIDIEGRLRVGGKLLLDFELTPEFPFTRLTGMVVYRQKVGQNLIKFGLHLFPNTAQKIALQNYIIQRHDEILDELEKDSIRMYEPRRVENLYF